MSKKPYRSRQRWRRVFVAAVAGLSIAALALTNPRVTPAHAAATVPAGNGGDLVEVCLAVGRPETARTVRVGAAAAAQLVRHTRSYPGPCAVYGPAITVGAGRVRIYAQLDGDRPVSLGYVLDRSFLTDLPAAPTDGKHCYDSNGDGSIDPGTECSHEHEYLLDVPREYRERIGGPFTWAMLNWDPHGHAPDPVYGVPHFDLHFYLQDRAAAMAIRTGPCGGANLVDCADYATARQPVPARYLPAGYVDIDAVVPGMGNHLGDPAAPEFNGQPFTRTFMYGAYGGDLTFYEPMINKTWFEDLAAGRAAPSCQPIKLPSAWKVAGWYPTGYCTAYRPNRQEFTVSMNNFVYRNAS